MNNPELYKLNLKTSTSDRQGLIDYCLSESVIGLGWGASKWLGNTSLTSFDDYLEAVHNNPWTWSQLAAPRALEAAPEGSLVWFRDLDNAYYLARLVGPWRPVSGSRVEELDLGQVRDVKLWKADSEIDVPGAVIRGFAAPRQHAFAKVKNDGAKLYSALLADKQWGTGVVFPESTDLGPKAILESFLSPLDVEDLVAAYLQRDGEYIVFPGRHSRSNPVYEFLLTNRTNGQTAAVQVKTGSAELVPERLSPEVADDWFVYSAVGQDLPSHVTRITTSELVDFMNSGHPAMPKVVALWIERIQEFS